jgi:hypothetical protein
MGKAHSSKAAASQLTGFGFEDIRRIVSVIDREITKFLRKVEEPLAELGRWSEAEAPWSAILDTVLPYLEVLWGYDSGLKGLHDSLMRLQMATPETSPQSSVGASQSNEGQPGVNESGLHIESLRDQVFAAITDDVWDEARRGFGDPDLANV